MQRKGACRNEASLVEVPNPTLVSFAYSSSSALLDYQKHLVVGPLTAVGGELALLRICASYLPPSANPFSGAMRHEKSDIRQVWLTSQVGSGPAYLLSNGMSLLQKYCTLHE
jgi:hypothetical protein